MGQRNAHAGAAGIAHIASGLGVACGHDEVQLLSAPVMKASTMVLPAGIVLATLARMLIGGGKRYLGRRTAAGRISVASRSYSIRSAIIAGFEYPVGDRI